MLDLNSFSGAYLPVLQDLRAEIESFKESGKPVIANADFYGDSQYYLASTAGEIYLHHMGTVLLDGYSRFRSYYKEGLDRAVDQSGDLFQPLLDVLVELHLDQRGQ